MHTIIHRIAISQPCMTGFVTWPPFLYYDYVKGGQVTKPIMHGCEIRSYPVNYCVHIFKVRFLNN